MKIFKLFFKLRLQILIFVANVARSVGDCLIKLNFRVVCDILGNHGSSIKHGGRFLWLFPGNNLLLRVFLWFELYRLSQHQRRQQ